MQKFRNVMYTIQDNKGLFRKKHIDQMIDGYINSSADNDDGLLPPMSIERVKQCPL